MHHVLLATATALLSALCSAASSTFKHRAAQETPSAVDLGVRSLGRMLRSLARHRLAGAAVVADVLGVAGQITALRLGSLAVVQLVLTTAVVFAVLFRGQVRRAQVAWSAMTAVALGVVLVLAAPSAGTRVADHEPAIVLAAVGGAVVAGLLIVSRNRRVRQQAQTLLAVAVGVVYAGTASLLKAVTDVAGRHGLLAVTLSWQLYAAVLCGAIGVLLGQIAFQAGPLASGLPVTATVDPLACVVVGMLVYDQSIHLGRWTTPGLVLATVLLIVAVTRVVRSANPRPARMIRPAAG